MAKIWLARKGAEPTYGILFGKPWAEWLLDKIIAKLRLTPRNWISDLSKPPKFGKSTHLDRFRGPELIVVEVDELDIKNNSNFKPGFYLSSVNIEEFITDEGKEKFRNCRYKAQCLQRVLQLRKYHLLYEKPEGRPIKERVKKEKYEAANYCFRCIEYNK